MTQKPYLEATTSISRLSHEIHRREAVLFIIRNAEQGRYPYSLNYKNLDNREQKKAKAERELKVLKQQREQLKKATPKELWYPKRKYSGRYNNTPNEIKTLIMQDCVRAGFNVKSIAGYFGLALTSTYQRIRLKEMREFKEVLTERVKLFENKDGIS